MAQQVPYAGGEKESLRVSLDRHRDVVLWKLEGLSDEDADVKVGPQESTAEILAFYARARAAADQVIHVLEDTTRHAGHVDIMRELIDEMVGFHPPA